MWSVCLKAEHQRACFTENCKRELVLEADQENITLTLLRPILQCWPQHLGALSPWHDLTAAALAPQLERFQEFARLLQSRRDMRGRKQKAQHTHPLSSPVALVDRTAGLKLIFGLISRPTITDCRSSIELNRRLHHVFRNRQNFFFFPLKITQISFSLNISIQQAPQHNQTGKM